MLTTPAGASAAPIGRASAHAPSTIASAGACVAAARRSAASSAAAQAESSCAAARRPSGRAGAAAVGVQRVDRRAHRDREQRLGVERRGERLADPLHGDPQPPALALQRGQAGVGAGDADVAIAREREEQQRDAEQQQRRGGQRRDRVRGGHAGGEQQRVDRPDGRASRAAAARWRSRARAARAARSGDLERQLGGERGGEQPPRRLGRGGRARGEEHERRARRHATRRRPQVTSRSGQLRPAAQAPSVPSASPANTSSGTVAGAATTSSGGRKSWVGTR